MTESAALQAIDLSVGYQTRRRQCPVLSGLNFTVQPGEMVCLLGPNGIGKSTLLRTIARIQPRLAGSILVSGLDVQSLSPGELARRMGVVLTERVMVGALSGRQIVELGRYPHTGWAGRLSDRDHEVVSWAIEAAGAQHLADRDINRLSDGERQRLMIARAMAQEPSILLLDEPTAFLDVPSRVELMGLLRTLAREENLAVVISTHDLELALRMADTVWLVMPGGQLQCGAPEDVIMSGYIDEAFQSENIQFRPEERVFHPVRMAREKAAVSGSGIAAALVRAVLEREGYEISSEGDLKLTVIAGENGNVWNARFQDQTRCGKSFSELATLARELLRKN